MFDKNQKFRLTLLLERHRKNECEREAVLAQSALYVYERLGMYRKLDEDARQDFFIAFLPYLHHTIDTFRLEQVPLEVYLSIVIKRRIYGFLRRQHRQVTYWKFALAESFDPHYQPIEYCCGIPHDRFAKLIARSRGKRSPEPVARRRYLLWALKNFRAISMPDIARVARLGGVSEQTVAEITALLRSGTRQREMRFRRLAERRNKIFLFTRMLEQKMSRELDREQRNCLGRHLEKKRRALDNIRTALSRINLSATHRELSRALGIPKGSIDSDMARVRKALTLGAQEIRERSA